jgi:hypothetical protein
MAHTTAQVTSQSYRAARTSQPLGPRPCFHSSGSEKRAVVTQPHPPTIPNVPPPNPERIRLEQQMRGRISWLYWIAGLSALNSVLFWAGWTMQLVFGLGITRAIEQCLVDAARESGPGAGRIASTAALGLSLACAAAFVVLGALAMRRSLVAAALAIALYAADTLLVGLALGGPNDLAWLSIGFHAFVLLMLVGGTQAMLKLRRMDRSAIASPRRTATE